MRILVTGGCGFIGANLCHRLLASPNMTVRVLDNLSTGRQSYVDDVQRKAGRGIELLEGDIRDSAAVRTAVQGVTAVVHLAAKTSVVDSVESPQETFDVNVVGTQTLLEACRMQGVRRFVLASSSAVLGEQALPAHEQMAPKPISPYGAAKLGGEALCWAYCHSYGIRAIALRFSNAYGPYSAHKTSVIAKFINRARDGQPIIIYGDGSQTRDFIHVGDISRAIELALLHEPARGVDDRQGSSACESVVLQIATEKETSICEVAERVRDLALESGLEACTIRHEAAKRGEIRNSSACISKANEVLGFRPQVEFQNGLRDVWTSWAEAEIRC